MLNYLLKREKPASHHINIIAQYDDKTLLDKSGKLIQIIKLTGLDAFTKDEVTLDLYKKRRNSLFKNFNSEFALYFYETRRKINEYPAGKFTDAFSTGVNDKYKKQILKREMYRNELYIAVITKQPEGLINKGFTLLQNLSYVFDEEAKLLYLTKRHKELNDVVEKIISGLSDYQPSVLSTYEKKNVSFSESMPFLSQLINAEENVIPLEVGDISKALPRKRLFFNPRIGTVEIRSGDGKSKFIAMLSIKNYAPFTYQGILDELGKLKIEYIITQSFRFYDKHVAKTKMRNQQLDMMQSKDESVSQTEQIDKAFDEAASDEVGYGLHHFTLACFSDNQEELNKHVGTIIAKFSDVDITCVREDIGCECAFWAQLPGNFGYVFRSAPISTKNLAAFASLHNEPIGKIKENFWGDAVTVLETFSGRPYYFNFHYRDIGNFLIFGASGSGKTVVVGFLLLQSMKFGGKRIIFDKDRGLEILVRAKGGVYITIKPGQQTGFNPCHLEDTSDNRRFLAELFKKILTTQSEILIESDITLIESVISGMYRLEKSSRQFCHIASFFGTKKPGSLRARFDQWHSDGAYAWVFDNSIDTLNFSSEWIAFDLTHILSHKECKTPVVMYMTYRSEKALEEERGVIFADEGWQMLDDDYFKVRINDWSRTNRKKNNIFGLATQAANDTVNTTISKTINESAFCKIFFPNSSADRKVYVEELGLTEYEYYLIKSIPDDKHYFLLVYGRGVNRQSIIVRLNLTGMEDEIAIISAREQTLGLLDQLRTEVGDDPEIWLPLFHQRRKKVT